jgi:3-dehydroquinate dehydratase-2
MKKILVLHGVNLNMFGKRDPTHYGTITFNEINDRLERLARELGCTVETFQTNHEGELVERIHRAHEEKIDAIIINAGAWTYYSYALRDALAILKVPIIDVHMSNIHARRRDFPDHSLIASLATGQICGFRVHSYLLALRAALELLKDEEREKG